MRRTRVRYRPHQPVTTSPSSFRWCLEIKHIIIINVSVRARLIRQPTTDTERKVRAGVVQRRQRDSTKAMVVVEWWWNWWCRHIPPIGGSRISFRRDVLMVPLSYMMVWAESCPYHRRDGRVNPISNYVSGFLGSERVWFGPV